MKLYWSKHVSGVTVVVGLLLLAGCQQMGAQSGSGQSAKAAGTLPQGFTCCNLHYEKDWISDANWGGMAMIPAGTPAKVISYGRHRAAVEIGGKPMRLGHDYGRDQETLEKWVEKIIVEADPKSKIATYPAEVQDAIRQGRVMPGMTKEQVIIAVGYPITNETRSLDSPTWRHWLSSFGEYQLNWDGDGRVREIVGDATVKNMVVYQPR